MRGMIGQVFLGLVVLAAVFVITYVLASLWISIWGPLKRRRSPKLTRRRSGA